MISSEKIQTVSNQSAEPTTRHTEMEIVGRRSLSGCSKRWCRSPGKSSRSQTKSARQKTGDAVDGENDQLKRKKCEKNRLLSAESAKPQETSGTNGEVEEDSQPLR